MQQVILALSPRAARLLDFAISWTTQLDEEDVVDLFNSVDEAETCLSAIQNEIAAQLGRDTAAQERYVNDDVKIVEPSTAEVIAGKMAKASREAATVHEEGE